MLAIFHDMLQSKKSSWMTFSSLGISLKIASHRLEKMLQKDVKTQFVSNWEKSHLGIPSSESSIEQQSLLAFETGKLDLSTAGDHRKRFHFNELNRTS
ncbi:hypothetical protein Tco_0514633 [Tanacetum coccineum]